MKSQTKVDIAKRRQRLKAVYTIFVIGISVLPLYQNCSQVDFATLESLSKGEGDNQIVPEFQTVTAGDVDSFPRLKLVFVVDNSGTMGINQINLSSSFGRLFDGANETNLAPFDASAIVINTSQASVAQTDSVFGRVSGANYSGLLGRARVLDGSIPGDLVGYKMANQADASGSTWKFLPAPVALMSADAAGSPSLASHKPSLADVSVFARDFADRIDVLDPARSAVDPVERRGVLDTVVDRESGLCALSRVLKNNEGLINEGDLASFILVSDEDDQDPSGRSCLDSIVEGRTDARYVDGRCEQERTRLSYRREIANPTQAKCEVSFKTGFQYRHDYTVPSTNITYYTRKTAYDQKRILVTYYKSQMKYDQLRTSVAYYTSKMAYDAVSTQVSYHTKAPTYQTPRTSVRYYTEVETCDMRDNAKINCIYTYPESTVVLNGAFGSNCDAFVAGKLPNGALYTKAGYKPVCSQGTPVMQSGACSADDPNILNCNQNYSAVKTLVLSGKPGANGCAAFVSGRLGSGAVYTDAGYVPVCGQKILTAAEGSCSVSDADKENCRTIYTAAPAKILDGVPGSQSCSSFVSGKLGSGAVYNLSGYLPVCSSTTAATGKVGNCSTSDPNVTNCRVEYLGPYTATYNGDVNSVANCDAYAQGKLGTSSGVVYGNSAKAIRCENTTPTVGVIGSCGNQSDRINCRNVDEGPFTVNREGTPSTDCGAFTAAKVGGTAVTSMSDPKKPTCTNGSPIAKNVTGEELYTNALWASYNPSINEACSAALVNRIVSKHGLTGSTATTCKITGIRTGTEILSQANADLTCAVANWMNVCTASNSSKRDCSSRDIAAGDRYETNVTNLDVNGRVTCETTCSSTDFCTTKSGKVGDNYYACQAAPIANAVRSTYMMQPPTRLDVCPTGQVNIVTRGPYQNPETRVSYVAGAASENAEDNALAKYIKSRSEELFKSDVPSVSVFVRQPGDELGTNGSVGSAYNVLADMMDGKKRSVLSDADGYASALEDLSKQVRERLGRSISVSGLRMGQKVRNVWYRKAGAADFGEPLPVSKWSASGGTITFLDGFEYQFGDEFRVEFW